MTLILSILWSFFRPFIGYALIGVGIIATVFIAMASQKKAGRMAERVDQLKAGIKAAGERSDVETAVDRLDVGGIRGKLRSKYKRP